LSIPNVWKEYRLIEVKVKRMKYPIFSLFSPFYYLIVTRCRAIKFHSKGTHCLDPFLPWAVTLESRSWARASAEEKEEIFRFSPLFYPVPKGKKQRGGRAGKHYQIGKSQGSQAPVGGRRPKVTSLFLVNPLDCMQRSGEFSLA
jgi:hypothetical protein